MTYPYSVMRTLAGPMASSMKTVYVARIQAVEARTLRSLQAGATPDRAEELQTLLNGCRAALEVLEETPEIIERWNADQGNTSTGEDDGDDSPSLMSIEDLPNPLLLAGIIFLTGLLPLGLATVTAFVKIVVVLSILRNALGLQQTPPNLVINAGAIVLTLYVMYPVVIKIGNGLEALPPGREGLVLITSAIPIVIENIRAFMSPLIEPGKLDFFMSTAAKIWPADVMETVTPDDFLIVLPSFFVSEMQSALELGVIIFIPFLIIDMLVANTMMALGMIMVPPTMIALPIKLMFFVGVSGWSLVIDRLLSSYAVGL